MNDVAIRAVELGKQYRIGEAQDAYGSVRDALASTVRKSIRRATGNGSPKRNWREFWALRNVSFEVHRGEVLGIIGRNGAGKSTLLKVISRITEPSTGYAEIQGRVGSLLEVGTGFHPELTGRENIYLNGAILGMTRREIESKFQEITAFAEIDQFLDTPVKRYSSGMYVRLAFAVAAHLEPEILIVDEVLAVGDVAFQQKCLGKMDEVAKSGRTVLFVTHNMGAVQHLTDRCLLIDHGQVIAEGPSTNIVARYLDTAMDWSTQVYQVADMPKRAAELSRAVELISLELDSHPNKLVSPDSELEFHFTVRGNQAVSNFRFMVTIEWLEGRPVGTAFSAEDCSIRAGEYASFSLKFPNLRLAPGRYHCNIAVGVGDYQSVRTDFDAVSQVLHFEVLYPDGHGQTRAEWYAEWGPVRLVRPEVDRIV